MPTNFWPFVYVIAEPKLVVISLLALKWQVFKVEALSFFLFLCSKIMEKINGSTLKTYHFKVSGDITTKFGSTIIYTNDRKLVGMT